MIALAAGDPARVTVVSEDGADVRQVTTGEEPDPRAEECGYFEESAPQWSPDGTQIAFVRWYDPGTSLCVIGADGTGFRVVVPEFHGGQLAWSPDGRCAATQVLPKRRGPNLRLTGRTALRGCAHFRV